MTSSALTHPNQPKKRPSYLPETSTKAEPAERDAELTARRLMNHYLRVQALCREAAVESFKARKGNYPPRDKRDIRSDPSPLCDCGGTGIVTIVAGDEPMGKYGRLLYETDSGWKIGTCVCAEQYLPSAPERPWYQESVEWVL